MVKGGLIIDSDKDKSIWDRQSTGRKVGLVIGIGIGSLFLMVIIAFFVVMFNPVIQTNNTTIHTNTQTTDSNISVTNNTISSTESNTQEMTKYDMGYEHGYLDGYDGDTSKSFSGDFGKGYSMGYENGMNDAGLGLEPEWQVNNIVYKRWSPSDTAYVDITTGQMVN